jgi:hypothetical protein
MTDQWLDEAKRLLAEANGGDVPFQRLQAQGLVNERGEVTGHLHRWDAFLAITEVKPDPTAKKIASFRCLKPFFGMPGRATIDVRRESIVADLAQGKKIITASWDANLKMWREGSRVRLTGKSFIRTDDQEELADDLGSLPEFHQVQTRL